MTAFLKELEHTPEAEPENLASEPAPEEVVPEPESVATVAEPEPEPAAPAPKATSESSDSSQESTTTIEGTPVSILATQSKLTHSHLKDSYANAGHAIGTSAA